MPAATTVIVVALFSLGCETIDRPSPQPYFAEAVVPTAQEFRWINGGMTRSFDPSLTRVPPETDIVRAIFEGLTITDPKTLEPRPGVAEKWTSTKDKRVWTFDLRKSARWSNGKPVTAGDFVRSWTRLFDIGEKAALPELLANFEKVTSTDSESSPASSAKPSHGANDSADQSVPDGPASIPGDTLVSKDAETENGGGKLQLAVIAEGDHRLIVRLIAPDPEFPRLLAHPMFCPVPDGAFTNDDPPDVTNGPFRIDEFGKNGLVLKRSDTYWDRESVTLDSVRFLMAKSVDEALEAYRSGAVDAVTNIEYEPVVLKLLAPYEDFRRATHGAINLYDINTSKPPFNDRRIREAFAISIEREKLTEGEMEGATRPAARFLPFGGATTLGIVQDVERAKSLLAAAGYPEGRGFPTITLVVNRNEAQIRIARAVARMWQTNLNVGTEIITKESTEMAEARRLGEYDLIRRGVVFPTDNSVSNLSLIFIERSLPGIEQPSVAIGNTEARFRDTASVENDPVTRRPSDRQNEAEVEGRPAFPSLTEEQALIDLNSIPLYFPTSYFLVKPYIKGFEPNGLDAYDLRAVSIDRSWRSEARP